jgi:hypothetical protein
MGRRSVAQSYRKPIFAAPSQPYNDPAVGRPMENDALRARLLGDLGQSA